MGEESQETSPGDGEQPRRVVRRVVRRTVAAPPPPTAAPRERAPEPVAEREVDPDRAPDPSRPASHRARPSFTLPRISWPSWPAGGRREDEPQPPEEPTPVATTTLDPEPELHGPADEDAAPAGPSWRDRTTATLDRTRDSIASTTASLVDRAQALPLPAAAAVVGAVTGLLAAIVCWLATLVFSALLGTPAGGGWGFAVLVLVGVGAVVASRRALDALGAPDPTATALVGVLLVPVVVLALFLGPSTTAWAFLIVPVVAALGFAAAQPAVARLSTIPEDR